MQNMLPRGERTQKKKKRRKEANLNNDTERTRKDSALERSNTRELTINIKDLFHHVGVVEALHVLGVVLLEWDDQKALDLYCTFVSK